MCLNSRADMDRLQVWLVAYRNFSSLAQPALPAPAALREAPELAIPACSNPNMAAVMSAFKPCTPIATARNSTVETIHGNGDTRHAVTLDVLVTIRPGLSGLQMLQQQCQYTDVFGLGSDVASLHLIAQDTSKTHQGVAVECSSGSIDVSSAVWLKSCRCDHCKHA